MNTGNGEAITDLATEGALAVTQLRDFAVGARQTPPDAAEEDDAQYAFLQTADGKAEISRWAAQFEDTVEESRQWLTFTTDDPHRTFGQATKVTRHTTQALRDFDKRLTRLLG